MAAKKLRSARELYAREGCIRTALAPDGRTLACLDGKFALARLDLPSGQAFEHRKLGDTPAWRRGFYAVQRKPLKKGGGLDENVTLAVSDAVTGAGLWSRDFSREAPRAFVDESAGTMVFSWGVKSDHAKAEIKADSRLKERFAAMEFFGRAPAVSKAAGLLSVETERGQLTLFDLATGERRDRFAFAAPVSLAHFSDDGKRLLVLTADRTVYVLALTAK